MRWEKKSGAGAIFFDKLSVFDIADLRLPNRIDRNLFQTYL